MSDLIVIGYPDEETAEKVWDELVKLQAGLSWSTWRTRPSSGVTRKGGCTSRPRPITR